MCLRVFAETYDLTISHQDLLEIKLNLARETKSAFYTHKIYYSKNVHIVDGLVRNSSKRLIEMGNAGGLSAVSEGMSCEILGILFNAQKIRTETEVMYDFSNWKMVDFTIKIPNYYTNKFDNIGISVTRAMHYRNADLFDAAEAERLIYKKLNGLVLARNGVSEIDSFHKTILHIFAQTARIAELLHDAFLNLDPETKDNVIVLCTVTDCPFIFNNEYQYVSPSVPHKKNV